MTRFTIPIRTMTESNTGGHWRTRARRAKEQRQVATLFTNAYLTGGAVPKRVKLTRISRGKLDSHDNLASALKHVVDGIADAFEVDDGRSGIRWEYDQAVGKEPAVVVEW